MPSPEQDGLVRALLADPWDDLARAAYADWLEENGTPLHAAMARDRTSGLPPGLEATVREGFDGVVMGVNSVHGLLFVQVRLTGFLSDWFQREGPAWLERNRVVILSLAGAGDWRSVAQAPALAHVPALMLQGGQLRDGAAEALAVSPRLGALAFLELFVVEASLAGFGAILRSEALPRLVRLGLAQTEIGPRLLEALGGGPLAGRLEHLDLGLSQMGDRGAATLAAMASLLGGLITLRVGGSMLGDDGVRAIAASHTARLRSLELSGWRIGDAGKAALAESALLRGLRWLSLRGNMRGTASGWRTLGRAAMEVQGLRLAVGALAAPMLAELREVPGSRLVAG